MTTDQHHEQDGEVFECDDMVFVGHLKNVPDGRRWMTPAEYESFMEQRTHRLKDADWARCGDYGLGPEAASVFWYLHAHGVWEASLAGAGRLNPPGHADFRVTSDQSIQCATSLDEDSVRRALVELEEKGFIRRKPIFLGHGDRRIQINDDIEFTMPEDWCPSCHERGEHQCMPDRPCPDYVEAYREKFGDDAARRYFETDDLETVGHKH